MIKWFTNVIDSKIFLSISQTKGTRMRMGHLNVTFGEVLCRDIVKRIICICAFSFFPQGIFTVLSSQVSSFGKI